MAAPIALTPAQAARASQAFELLRQGQAAAAVPLARALVAEAPRAVDAQQLLALVLVQSGDAAAAERAFRVALELVPGQPAVLGNLATLLRRQGRAAEALDCWQQVLEAQPHNVQAWLDTGLTRLELARPKEAVTALRRAVELDPRAVRAWQGLGSALRAIDDLPGAEAACRQALALDPRRGPVWANLGVVLRLSGRPAEGVDCLQCARELGAGSAEVLEALVGALTDAGQLDSARALARELTATHPGHVSGHLTLADLLWEYGDPAQPGRDPLAEFHAAVAARPDDPALHLALAGFLLEARRIEEALTLIERLRRRSDTPLLISLHANALELQERPALSAPLYAQAHAAFGGRDAAFLCAYARHLLKAGDPQAAAARLEQALALEPDLQEAWAYLATAWRLLDDPREHWLCDYERLVTLIEVEVPPGYANQSDFLAALRGTLEPLHQARAAPVRQSLRHGSQTPGRLFGRPDSHLTAAAAAFRATVHAWLRDLPSDPSHPFRRRPHGQGVRYTGSWSVQLWQSGRHANHFHNEGWISSAFYVALPPSVSAIGAAAQAGHIQFGQPPEELGLALPPRRVIQPQVGHLALFPSYLWHGTVPFFDAEPRLTMAFDLVPA